LLNRVLPEAPQQAVALGDVLHGIDGIGEGDVLSLDRGSPRFASPGEGFQQVTSENFSAGMLIHGAVRLFLKAPDAD
jgi:hypothetical protein